MRLNLSHRGLCFLMGCLWPLMLVHANPASLQSPLRLLQGKSERLLTVLRNKPNVSKIKKHVQAKILPLMDQHYMARLIVGPYHWRSATTSQRGIFVSELTQLIIDTYAAAWSTYRNERIEFAPLRPALEKQARVNIKSWIIYADGRRIPVTYHMYRVSGQWKVYDFDVNAVSLVESYKAQFASVLASGGMPALIKRLKTHNDQTHVLHPSKKLKHLACMCDNAQVISGQSL